MAMAKWFITNSAAYAAAVKDNNALYFLEDTKEIYKGSVPYTESAQFYTDTLPAKGALGKIYFNQATLAGSVWTGTEWKEIVQAVSHDVMIEDAATLKPVSGQAVKDYVASVVGGSAFTDFMYDPATKSLKYKISGVEYVVQLEKLGTNLSYDGATGVLKMTDAVGAELSSINLPKDNFVVSGTYDNAKNQIVLTLQSGDKVNIPAADLVTLYIGQKTHGADVKISVDETTGDNVIKVDLILSADADNCLELRENGLYAVKTDVTGKMDKVGEGKENQLLLADATGNAKAAGIIVGGATLSDTPDALTLATEAAVAAMRTALETKVADEYVAKTDIVGSLASINVDAASESKVVSEKALVEAMAWNVL